MKTIKTQSSDLIVVEVPGDAYDFEWKCLYNWRNWKLVYFLRGEPRIWSKSINYFDSGIPYIYKEKLPKILGKLSKLEDKDLEKFVEYKTNSKWYKNYTIGLGGINWHEFKSPKKSFMSLLQSNGIDISKELLIIEVL